MAVINGSEKDFDNLISNGTILVDFYANWCGPCKMLRPILEEISNDRDELKIVKIDVDQNENLSKSYGIMSIPTMVLFKDGKLISKQTGFMPKELITKWIEDNK